MFWYGYVIGMIIGAVVSWLLFMWYTNQPVIEYVKIDEFCKPCKTANAELLQSVIDAKVRQRNAEKSIDGLRKKMEGKPSE